MSKKVSILGAKESGVSAALLAQKMGYTVFVSDYGTVKDTFAQTLNENNIAWEQNTHSTQEILESDLVIISPGVPQNAKIVQEVIKNNIELIAEVEFAFRHKNPESKIIAITGSNGKTTTTLLANHILITANKSSVACGNVGLSFSRAILEQPSDYYVLELSSFQLDNISTFKPNVAVILNITPDHLDRYEYEFQNYIDAKFKIIQNQDENDFFVYNLDDEVIMQNLNNKNILSNKLPFTLMENSSELMASTVIDEQIHLKTQEKKLFIMETNQISIKGKHNLQNSLAAANAVTAMSSADYNSLKNGLSTFVNVEHRMEKVRSYNGITFINDSKATNINSVWYALESVQGPIIWLVGGVDKGNDYEVLKEFAIKKVSNIICIGKENDKIIESFQETVARPIVEITNMKDAVNYAFEIAKPGTTVLLSPACASFDFYDNYEDRGRQFTKAAISVKREDPLYSK